MIFYAFRLHRRKGSKPHVQGDLVFLDALLPEYQKKAREARAKGKILSFVRKSDWDICQYTLRRLCKTRIFGQDQGQREFKTAAY